MKCEDCGKESTESFSKLSKGQSTSVCKECKTFIGMGNPFVAKAMKSGRIRIG